MEISEHLSIFFKEVYIKNIRCFKSSYLVDLTNKKGSPAHWTVLLGNNNTGKTTFLRSISDLEPKYLTLPKSDDKTQTPPIAPNNMIKNITGGENTIMTIDIGRVPKEVINEYEIRCNFLTSNKINKSLKIAKFKDHPRNNNKGKIGTNSSYAWGFDSRTWDAANREEQIQNLVLYGYGIHRKTNRGTLTDSQQEDATIGLFKEVGLINFEEWILQTDYAVKNGNKHAEKVYRKIKSIFIDSKILPDVFDFRSVTTNDLKTYVEMLTSFGWIQIGSLGYGYQSTIAWLADLAKRMFDRYPELENPLHGPAVVLIDEIDLHLHPDWQRKIIKYLSNLFPNTQFIVTAHSPLIVQSAENVNLIMLEKDEETGSINIRQQFGSFQGWTVEEILRELMDMGEKTRSDKYLELMRQFEDALLSENYADAKIAYDGLDRILSPTSHQRKVLSIQLSTITPVHS